MQSGACAGNIEKLLYGVKGVQSAVVTFALESAEIVYDPAQANAAMFAGVVAAAGYVPHLPDAVLAADAAGTSAPPSKGIVNSGCG
jgi:copper chaperone CopZ